MYQITWHSDSALLQCTEAALSVYCNCAHRSTSFFVCFLLLTNLPEAPFCLQRQVVTTATARLLLRSTQRFTLCAPQLCCTTLLAYPALNLVTKLLNARRLCCAIAALLRQQQLTPCVHCESRESLLGVVFSDFFCTQHAVAARMHIAAFLQCTTFGYTTLNTTGCHGPGHCCSAGWVVSACTQQCTHTSRWLLMFFAAGW